MWTRWSLADTSFGIPSRVLCVLSKKTTSAPESACRRNITTKPSVCWLPQKRAIMMHCTKSFYSLQSRILFCESAANKPAPSNGYRSLPVHKPLLYSAPSKIKHNKNSSRILSITTNAVALFSKRTILLGLSVAAVGVVAKNLFKQHHGTLSTDYLHLESKKLYSYVHGNKLWMVSGTASFYVVTKFVTAESRRRFTKDTFDCPHRSLSLPIRNKNHSTYLQFVLASDTLQAARQSVTVCQLSSHTR